MPRHDGLGMNEIMIINPSANGVRNMFGRLNGSYFGQAPEDDLGWYGIAGGVGQDPYVDENYASIPMDELGADEWEGVGSIPMDELSGCPGCGGQQLGYFSDDEDRELIGRFCPSCGGGGHISEADLDQYGAYEDDLTGWIGQDVDEGYAAWLADDENYTDAPTTGFFAQDADGDEMGALADEYGAEDVGWYGPYRDESMGAYVRDVRPPFNPEGDFGTQLSGYEQEKSVNPDAVLRRTVPGSPMNSVPSIFKPYF